MFCVAESLFKNIFPGPDPRVSEPVGLRESPVIYNSKNFPDDENHCSRHAGLLAFLICLNIQRTLPVQGLHTGCFFCQEDTFPGYLYVTEF